jgi:tol-pal system protein YbgF
MRARFAPALAIPFVFCLALAGPNAGAQTAAPKPVERSAVDLNKRVDKLETEMRAVQRKVFPGGSPRFFEPEFPAQTATPVAPAQTPPTNPLGDLQVRVDALEKHIADLTGQIEQQGFRIKQMEDQLGKFRADSEFRLNRLEGKDSAATDMSAPAASAAPTAAAPATKPAAAPQLGEEDEFRAAYAFIPQRDFAQAEAKLQAFYGRYPKGPRAADALYWTGRAQMAQQKHGAAAKSFLDGYKQFPKSARAPESLLSLGDALVALGNPAEACKAYNEMLVVYPSASPDLKKRLSTARTKAKCA